MPNVDQNYSSGLPSNGDFFEITKPQGDTNLPPALDPNVPTEDPWNILARKSQNAPPIIPNYTEEQKEILSAWSGWKLQYSEFLNMYIKTDLELLNHVRLYSESLLKTQQVTQRAEEKQNVVNRRAEREQQKQEQESYATAYMAWQRTCQDRKDNIAKANIEWRRRVDLQKQAIRQWADYVAEARTALASLKDSEIPRAPLKE